MTAEATGATFDQIPVSIVLTLSDALPYDLAAFQASLRAALAQDHPATELLMVDRRGPAAQPDFLPDGIDRGRVRHVPGTYANRAAACNAALAAAHGQFVLFLFNEEAQVLLKRSAVTAMLMAVVRRANTSPPGDRPLGFVYADYERIAADGRRQDVHLLDWHEGRLRDTVDFGQAILYSTAALREVGGFNEAYAAADFYDLRLRLSECHALVHVANRFAGSLYSVRAPARQYNVFDYLLAGKTTQLEMERACTEHLKRIGAYLVSGAHVRTVPSEPPETTPGSACVASIVIPVNNRPGFIGRAIESVQAQTDRRVEVVVVVNGGDGDPTSDTVRRYQAGGDHYSADAPLVRLIVVDVNNLGLCLNTGIAAARGQYYVQLDSDDRLKPNAVEKLLEVFDLDQTIGMVIGSYEVWTLDEQTSQLRRNEEIPVVTHDEWTADNGRNNLLRINGAGAPRAARLSVIREMGWFGVNDSPDCRNYGEDYDLVLRISEHYTIGRVWEPIYEVIRHSGGTDHAIDQATIERNDNAKDYMRREALRRRRALNGTTEAQRHREMR